MGYSWALSLLLLHFFHSSIALPAEKATKPQQHVEGVQQMVPAIDDPESDVSDEEIGTRNQDPTENLVCRFYKKVPEGVIMVPPSSAHHTVYKYMKTLSSVENRQYLYSPSIYAALCVSPDKPKPFPFFFAPPAPISTPIVAPTVPELQVIKGPTAVVPSAVVVPQTAGALSAPPPAISLVFSNAVGSIGIGAVNSPAVNIETQSITDNSAHPKNLFRRMMLPFR